jgi:DNA-binding ferritin-like protein
VFRLLKRLRERHEQGEQDMAAIAKARHEAERAGDEPEKSMLDTVMETYDKFPDGGPV